MSLPPASLDVALRFQAPASLYLDIADARLGRQKQYARLLTRGSHATDELQRLMSRASKCIAELARPQAVFLPVTAQVVADGVRIAERVTLEDETLARDIEGGGTVAAYLLTLGFDQAIAFEWLGRDYVAHHIQSDLASEVLFALGRDAHDRFDAQEPAGRLRRISVQADAPFGQRKVWDPVRIRALMDVFENENLGVTVAGTGCFQPLNSLLGLTVRR